MDCFDILMEHEVTCYGPPTISRDSGGGTTITWSTTRTSGIRCLISAPQTSTSERFGQEQLQGTVTVATFDTTVQRGDKLTVNTGPYSGYSLHVTGVKRQVGGLLGFETIYHIQCEILE